MTAKTFSKYRNVWIGFAMLWILWCHFTDSSPGGILGFLKEIGYGGVDICLFASGFGCWFSLQKDPDTWRFIKRRLIRLFPTYLCVILVWIVYRELTNPLPVSAILGNLLGVQYFTGRGNCFNWYIGAILLIYLLMPYLYGCVKKTEQPLHHLLVILGLVMFSLPFWYADNYIVTVARFPLVYMGLLFGKLCSREAFPKELPVPAVAASVVGGLMLYLSYQLFPDRLWSNGLYWYPFILITPGLCILISCLGQRLEKSGPGKAVVMVLETMGQYSFEIYLVHVVVFEVLRYLIRKAILPDTLLIWCVSLVLIVLLCALLRRTVTCLCAVCKKTMKGKII